jgi:hypothetical protein
LLIVTNGKYSPQHSGHEGKFLDIENHVNIAFAKGPTKACLHYLFLL